MTSRTKDKLDTLISDGKVQHIYGVIGCCKNYYVQFPNETQSSRKLSNKFPTIYILKQICNPPGLVMTLQPRPKVQGND